MRTGFVIPYATEGEFAELARLGEDRGWDAVFGWEALYGVRGMKVDTAKAALPNARPPSGLPVFAKDGEILPPMARAEEKASGSVKPRSKERKR